MSYDPKTGILEFGGKTMYSTRNYNPSNYTQNKMKASSVAKLMWSDLIRQAYLAKTRCLFESGHEPDEQMFAIEKDEDYYPEFKTCVKDSIVEFMNGRKAASEQNAAIFHYDLNDEKIDEAIDRGLDQIKLNELRESDLVIYASVKAELQNKYEGGGASAADDDE